MVYIKQWIIALFNGPLSVPKLAIYFAIAIAVEVIAVLIINGMLSGMAKIRRSEKRMTKFFGYQTIISPENVSKFRKRCINCLPKRVKKAWGEFEKAGKPIRVSSYEEAVKKSMQKGGVLAFLAYLYSFIFIVIAFVTSAMISNLDEYTVSVYMCGTLAIGSLGLIIIAIQLFVLDKMATSAVTNIIETVYSRSALFNPVKPVVICEKANRAESVEKLEQIKADNYAKSMNCYKRLEELAERNSLKDLRSAIEEVDNAKKFQSIEQLMVKEEKIGEGFSSFNGELAEEKPTDKILELESLIDKIIKIGVSHELLSLIKESIQAVARTNYNKPIDQLRMKCIINKLDVVI